MPHPPHHLSHTLRWHGFTLLLLLILTSHGLTACATSEHPDLNIPTPQPTTTSNATATSPPSYKIALVTKTRTNPFFMQLEQGAQAAAQENNIALNIYMAGEETAISQQINDVQSIIQRGDIDALVIAPSDSIELIPILKKAQDAGILVVVVDNWLDPHVMQIHGLSNVPHITVDNEQGAYLAARHVAQQVQNPTQAIILEGVTVAQNAQARRTGAQHALEENPYISIVGTASGNWKLEEAYDLTQNFFQLYPEIGLIVAGNDMMALGAIKYLQETGRQGVLVSGFDGIELARTALAEGTLHATVDQQPYEQGYLGVKTAYQLLSGGQVGVDLPLTQLVAVRLVTEP
jgi:ribose transport system substrate-binding protein